MTEKFIGLVLRTIKYSDNLMIADMYTRGHGRISFLVPVSRSRRSKVSSVLFRPLSMLAFTAPHRQGRALARLGNVQYHAVYSSVISDVYKTAIALYLAEFLSHVLREEGENEALFDFIEHALAWLDAADNGYADFHIVFMARLTRFLGICPNMENYSTGCYFDLSAGCLVDEQPMHGLFLSPEDSLNFMELLKVDFDSAHTLALNRKARGGYLALLENYYRVHIPDFPRLQSAEVLHELFD